MWRLTASSWIVGAADEEAEASDPKVGESPWLRRADEHRNARRHGQSERGGERERGGRGREGERRRERGERKRERERERERREREMSYKQGNIHTRLSLTVCRRFQCRHLSSDVEGKTPPLQ